MEERLWREGEVEGEVMERLWREGEVIEGRRRGDGGKVKEGEVIENNR